MGHVLLEKTDHLSDTIYKYQKGKHVMATPSNLVLRSDFDFDAGKREAILGTWDEQAASLGVNVRYNAEVVEITGETGNFQLKLKSGDTVSAEAVVMAIGTQGNPNVLRVPGADLPHIQYQLDDPGEYFDEHITVIGSGDAGIENALGLAADPAQRNTVTILNRSTEFARAKAANVSLLEEAETEGRIRIMRETSPSEVRDGELVLDTRDGQETIPCNRIIARTGSQPPRAFVEAAGIEFTSEDRSAFPQLSPSFETTKNGIHVIGALAGYPLIKHCMNQGYDVIEFLNGNDDLKPADEPILAEKFAKLPGNRSVDEWLEVFRNNITILQELSPLQMRELMLDSDVQAYRRDEVIFERDAPGSSMFGIAEGSVLVEVDPSDRTVTIPIEQGSIFGEVGLVSGRRRGSTIRAGGDTVVLELSRNAALKLMATVPSANRAVNAITIERQLLQMFRSGLLKEDVADIVADAELIETKAHEVILDENSDDTDLFVVRRGSVIVEKTVNDVPVFLNYLPAGTWFGNGIEIDGWSPGTQVRAAIKSEIVRFKGEKFAALMERNAQLQERVSSDLSTLRRMDMTAQERAERDVETVKEYSETARFLIDNGVGEATDVLLIDERLCVGCDNCEKACADSHNGISRLDREAGRSYAHLHVPTSCRHCEHPHCMADCPPNAIKRGPDSEVYIDDTCIGCGNCQRNCPYGVIRMEPDPPKKPGLLSWMLFGAGPGPGEASYGWRKTKAAKQGTESAKLATKCDMCIGIEGGPSCVRACPTGAAIRVSPERFLSVTKLEKAD